MGTRLLAPRSTAATRAGRVAESGLGALVTVLAVALLVPAVAGRRAPPETVALAAPLETGDYLVTSGGTSLSINNHLAFTAERYRPSWGQNHAVDLIAIDRWGLRADGLSPVEPTRYLIHGRRVLAPCAGTVQMSADDAPDMPVPTMDREHLLGNHVILGCESGVYVVLAHFAPGTLQVSPGDAVAVGETLGRAGNSGKSAEPHLHIHVQRDLPPEAPIGGESLWFTIDGRFLARGDILSVS